jgi:hypothetical protein
MADIAKLDAALAYIEQHPKEWIQSTYGQKDVRCGTAGCLAFHVGLIDGAEITWGRKWNGYQPIEEIGGVQPSAYAQRALGLDYEQAESLFFEWNTLADLKAMRDALAANPGISGDELYDLREAT